MSYRLCISDVVHYKMARDEAQHGTFSELTVYTLLHREAPYQLSCIDMVDSVQAQGIVGCRPGIVGVDDDRDGCMALEGTALES